MEIMNIDGFTDYLIFPDGKVYSNKTHKFLSPNSDNNGYLRISFKHNKKISTYRIHRLVALHYIPNPDNLPCVDHINGNKIDNRIKNLRWVSYEDNSKNMTICRSNTGHQGVSYVRQKDIFVAYTNINNKQYRKYFKNLEDAVAWRKEMVEKYYNRPQVQSS